MRPIYLLFTLACLTIIVALFVSYQLLNISLGTGPGLDLHTTYLPIERISVNNNQLTHKSAVVVVAAMRYGAIFLLIVYTATLFCIHKKINQSDRRTLLVLLFLQFMAFTPMIYRFFFPFTVF